MLYSFMCLELPGLSSLHLLLTEAEYGYIADFPEGETDSSTDSAAHWGTSVVYHTHGHTNSCESWTFNPYLSQISS